MSNMFPKGKSVGCLTTRHWEDEFFCNIWNIKWFNSTHDFIIHSKSFPTTLHMPKFELKRRNSDLDKLEKKTSCCVKTSVITHPETLSLSRHIQRHTQCRDTPTQCHDIRRWVMPLPVVLMEKLVTNGVFFLV